jgi:hypothetical protein
MLMGFFKASREPVEGVCYHGKYEDERQHDIISFLVLNKFESSHREIKKDEPFNAKNNYVP